MTAFEILQKHHDYITKSGENPAEYSEDCIIAAMEEYASQQREEGIREGFEAAREIDPLSKLQHFLIYPTADDYLNSK